MSRPQPLSVRFWKHVDVRGPDECWPWKASLHHGYGQFALKVRGAWQPVPAHRVAFLLSGGQTTAEQPLVLQSCGNRACCNPADLRAGSQRDVVRKRAKLAGERHWSAKLTDEHVRMLRAIADEGHVTQRALAERFGITQARVWQLVNGRART